MAGLLRSLAVAVAGTIGLTFPFHAVAQNFPTRPITLIVPFPAGGPTDLAMRALGEAAAKHLGQPVIVENKAGGAGTVGPATMAATAKPDGYTIAQMPITVYRLPLMQQTTWKADDFTYIIHLTGYVFAHIASATTPFKTWQDVVDYAKANPGKVTYGSSGTGGSPHLGTEQVAEKAGIKLTHVPFKGAAELHAAVAGGHVMVGAGGASSKQIVDAGKARFLNVWTAKRQKSFPDVPTLQELGYPFVIDSPFGIAGPKGMDPKVVVKLHDAFKKAIEDPAVIETLDRFEMVPNYKNSADYKLAVDEQIKLESALLERIGLLKK
ncbi:tripartite tricarboxylate transporter substrate binding protein [Bradyrhizobium sp. LHD-71]|uniref:tripartite tricarboxylate transporter substrate binding protein n=1 Tax=Bradyrhizobium sp. LHD-71 TaxID=3072141 RepID=UPI0028101325|nr:tripartite tricarboxylate transporter substrate binding protein [Bradyrhizobium sp. LHD-71]MDQ8728384.1 tripartite tricarboxylate transporter substrate binding protein [Bradyrhizobium sp. LHD-71]